MKHIEINSFLKERYLIRKELSNKDGRITYLARDRVLEKLVIIKVLLFSDRFQWENFKLFEREAQTLQNLDFPAIPKYLNYLEIDEKNLHGFALVQSYIDGLSLETMVREGCKFSEGDLIQLAEQILEILIYLHQQNPPVIHRDIKPSNILVANRSGHAIGNVYLVDFGAVQISAIKEHGTITIVGSYGYIPLEQFGGQTTTASDLYSLGMTLIYLITGVHPAELPQVNGRVQFNDTELSGKFLRWLDKMTHPHLDKRFNSAKSALIALKSQDGSSGDFLDLKPVNSQVKLYRDRHELKITYPIPYQEISFTCILFYVVFLPICILVISQYFNWSISILSILLLSVISFHNLWKYFQPKFEYIILSIKQNGNITKGIYLTEDGRKFSRNFSHSDFEDISLIAYNPGYIFNEYLDATGNKIKRGQVTIKPTLSIYAGNVEYELNEGGAQAELWWLGQELSDFLGLELKILYPTPKEPPEPSCGGGC
jgi:serine/threonine protein kinase